MVFSVGSCVAAVAGFLRGGYVDLGRSWLDVAVGFRGGRVAEGFREGRIVGFREGGFVAFGKVVGSGEGLVVFLV